MNVGTQYEWRTEWRLAVATCCFAILLLLSTEPSHAEPPLFHAGYSGNDFRTPAVIQIGPVANEIAVDRMHAKRLQMTSDSTAIVVWSDGGSDRWQLITADQAWSLPSKSTLANATGSDAAINTRGLQTGGGSDVTSGQLTVQLDQLLGQTVVRGRSLVTPANGYVLDGCITVRRAIAEDQPEHSLPADTGILMQGTRELIRFDLPADKQMQTYHEIAELAAKFPNGLPAGEYTLRLEIGGQSSTFTVEEPEWRDEVLAIPDRLAGLLEGKSDPLYLQVAVETMLNQVDENDKPLAYLSDALQLLESVPASSLNANLRSAHGAILDRLEGNRGIRNSESTIQKDTAEIPLLARAQRMIETGKWQLALEALNSENIAEELVASGREASQPKAEALATLYRAVIFSESGQGTESQARIAFQSSIQQIGEQCPEELYRAHVNYANFLLSNTQDRLYNHAFQVSTGGRNPILATLSTWIDANLQYERAVDLVEDNPNRLAGIQINQARLYALLGDLIRTLDVPIDNQRRFAAFEEAATERSLAFAKSAYNRQIAGSNEAIIQASSEEIQARIAFRRRRSQPCLQHAHAALGAYLEAGSIAGAEGIYRLLGLCHLRIQEFDLEPSLGENRDSDSIALKNFLISNALADFLRDRIPGDEIGMSQAGFFARRAYVNEKIVELLVEKNRCAEALSFAELAKARSLQDLLLAQRLQASTDYAQELSSTSELLSAWPADVAAIEYFVGSEKIWLFLVTREGIVKAFELLPAQQTSRDFIHEVQRYLSETDRFQDRYTAHLRRYSEFEKSWQDELHELFNVLIPAGVMEELREAQRVVIVPHHILHYFPFAALVTQRDEAIRGKLEMVEPRYVIDEPFELVYAPSLSVWNILRSSEDRAISNVNAVGIADYPGSFDDLPGVTKDIENVKAVFGNYVNSLSFDQEANLASAQRALAQPGLLLFATHGVNLADQPLDSYLWLNKQVDHDGHLTAKEIFAGTSQADLVVLSACYSGLADRSPLPGDDLFGIRRALLRSGARTVVSGLWRVDDVAAPELVRVFFERLAGGARAPQALAESQRAFLSIRRTADSSDIKKKLQLHPYYWAVYTAEGDDRTHFVK